MSDNVTNLNEKQKKWPVRRIILFAVLVLVVCLGVTAYVFRDSLNLDAARRFVRYLNVSVIMFNWIAFYLSNYVVNLPGIE